MTTRPKLLAGSGGGKDGSTSRRSPVEAPDTLKSVAYARVLDLLCEGEIEGLVDGFKSVYLNGVPVQNEDDSYNFSDVVLDEVHGTQAQGHIPGFPSAESETSVNEEVTHGSNELENANGLEGAVVRTITDPDTDAVRITIEIPALARRDVQRTVLHEGTIFEQTFLLGTGDILPASVQIAVDIQSNGGGYVERNLSTAGVFSGKCTSPYQRAFRFNLAGSPPWDIRVRRLTADALDAEDFDEDTVTDEPDPNLSNQTVWKSFSTIIDDKLSYPNSAIVAMQVSAHQFNSIPTRSYRIRGLKVKVPSNYNPETRAYTGTWDGTFNVAWTDNPAWCFYDLLTTARYGLGNFINEASVDKWGLYEIGRYCDELVPDGSGGTEPRFRCNLFLQTQEDAYRVVNNLASIFRGMVYWASGAVSVAQDAPRDPEYLFTPANVIDGLFTYSGSSKRSRHSVAIVTWNDPESRFRQTRELVTDEQSYLAFGYNPLEIVALGCTSRGQAIRLGKWALATERLETDTVTFRTGLEGALRNPGAIITIQDPYRAGRRYGGRLVSSTTTSVELDSDVELDEGTTYQLAVITPSGTVEEREVDFSASTPAHRKLALATPLTEQPVDNAIWVLTASDLVPVHYRVLSVSEVEKNIYEITALKHLAGKYDEVELGILAQEGPTSIIPSSLAPGGLTVGEELYLASTGIRVKLVARWNQNTRATEYIVRWRYEGGNWNTLTGYQTHFWERLDVPPGNYDVQVAAVIGGFITSFAEASYEVLGKLAPPTYPGVFTAVLNGNTVSLRWNEIPDLDRDQYELRYGGSDWDSATLIARIRGTGFEWSLPSSASYTVRLKAIDTSGIYSTGHATVSVNAAPTVPTSISLEISTTPPP